MILLEDSPDSCHGSSGLVETRCRACELSNHHSARIGIETFVHGSDFSRRSPVLRETGLRIRVRLDEVSSDDAISENVRHVR